MFRKLVFLCFTLLFSSSYTQEKFHPEIRIQYLLQAKTKHSSDIREERTYVLLAAKDLALFKTINNYIVDSLSVAGAGLNKIGEFYDMDHQENLVVSKEEIDFSNSVLNSEIGYKESNALEWQLHNDFKEINGIKSQKATTAKYGRNWIAYFASVYPFPFGPYKFNGLPGLIMQISDENDEFVYTAKIIQKYNSPTDLFRHKKTKYLSKENYLKVAENVKKDMTFGGRIAMSPDDLRSLQKMQEEKLADQNLLELTN